MPGFPGSKKTALRVEGTGKTRHNPEAGDDVLLADIQQKLSQRGYKLTALWEMPETAPGGELRPDVDGQAMV